MRRRELILAVEWFVRLRTDCLSCFDETQKKSGGRRPVIQNIKQISGLRAFSR